MNTCGPKMSDQNADSRKQAANYKGPKLQYIDLCEPFESPPSATNRLGSPRMGLGVSGVERRLAGQLPAEGERVQGRKKGGREAGREGWGRGKRLSQVEQVADGWQGTVEWCFLD